MIRTQLANSSCFFRCLWVNVIERILKIVRFVRIIILILYSFISSASCRVANVCGLVSILKTWIRRYNVGNVTYNEVRKFQGRSDQQRCVREGTGMLEICTYRERKLWERYFGTVLCCIGSRRFRNKIFKRNLFYPPDDYGVWALL